MATSGAALIPTVMVGVGLNLKSQSFLSHPHRGVGLLGHGQISFVSFKGLGHLGLVLLLGYGSRGTAPNLKHKPESASIKV